MNIAKIKSYAPEARIDFIKAVTERAAFYGLTAVKIEPAKEEGDVSIIAGRAFPLSITSKRKRLVDRIAQEGFARTMESLAYTWFNRFVAIRFMELHGYLDHGYCVLSHPDPNKTMPEILELAEHVDMPGLNKEKVIDLKLDGNKESELYRMLLLAQCHALHAAMPFLFEGIDDETELVLPENLLHSDSIIRKLVAASDSDDWQEVEVLGWLYQFYIKERKEEVMGRKSAVPTADIPAVTQLFTPHWIVRYLVENSLGRLWLLNRPNSRLREQMPYYIEGEAETDFLKVAKPEEIRLCDPACGSGHMLTYTFDLLTLIYEEEGYARSEIPALILRHNLYGLDICPRAAQLAAMALVFKAREKSRRFLQPEHLVQPNIIELQNVHFTDNELRDYIHALGLSSLFTQPMLKLLNQFEDAKNFGSLIQPCLDEQTIAYARQEIKAKDLGYHLFLRETHLKVLRVLEQAEALTQRYHVVVANPPYMGSGAMNENIRSFAKSLFDIAKTDLFAMFMMRSVELILPNCYMGMINLPSWLFLSTYEDLRNYVVDGFSIESLLHMGRGIFGIDWGSTAFILRKTHNPKKKGSFFRLHKRNFQHIYFDDIEAIFLNAKSDHNYRYDFDLYRGADGIREIGKQSDQNGLRIYHEIATSEFKKIPGSPIAYWISSKERESYSNGALLATYASPRKGIDTGENAYFLRIWSEVSFSRFSSTGPTKYKCWIPYNKGGDFRRWYGNREHVLRWKNGEDELQARLGWESKKPTLRNREFWFMEGYTWSTVSSVLFSVRYSPPGALFDNGGCTIFSQNSLHEIGCFLNSIVCKRYLEFLAPTLNYQPGDIGRLLYYPLHSSQIEDNVKDLLKLSRCDWDNFETSWDFSDLPLLQPELKATTLGASWRNWKAQCTSAIHRMQELETENNRLFIQAYGLEDELKPEVPEDQITLARADVKKDMAAFLSYAVGCMMGRYSLDQPGLILANAGDTMREFLTKVGRSLDQLTFVPDEDGIIPVLDSEWFEDDIVVRVGNFLRATFGEAVRDANVRFIEESLGKSLRDYFVSSFYKDHLQTYKKRPIYWLFSSGKQKAFQCLVYLHRYNEGTLARMRTEYVIKLQGKISTRIEQLTIDMDKASSTSHRKKLEKEKDKLLKQQTELQQFDEKLRHYADQKISLDLDDGVKVNYGKFSDLLAEVKAITGSSEE